LLRRYLSCTITTLILSVALVSLSEAATIELSEVRNGISLENQTRDDLTLRLQIGNISINPVQTKAGEFTMLSAAGLTRSYRVGEPNVLVCRKVIAIPEGCQLRAEVISSASAEISLNDHGFETLLKPSQPSLFKSDDPLSVPFEFNRDLYQEPGYYSRPLAEVEILGTMRGVRIGALTISPMEYNPSENKIRVHHDVEVRVTFDNPDWNKTERLRSVTYSPFFEPVLDQIINYHDQTSTRLDQITEYPVKYLIISDPMFESQLQPFIAWKSKKGFEVLAAYTDVIGQSNVRIATYIDSVYDADVFAGVSPPSFVLLVGDAQQIAPFNGSAGSHKTDRPFVELTGDNFPEIYCGRFSAQTTAQLQPQIDKTLEYEQYLMPDPSYLEKATLVAGVDHSFSQVWANGQINYGTNNYFNLAHGIDPNVWLYPESNSAGVAAEIISSVNDGVGLYNYTAHCSHSGHADPSFTTADLSSLTNTHQYLLGIGNCCLPNTFGTDYSTPCFGEQFLRLEDRGGIGYIGATNNTQWDQDYYWGVGFGPIVEHPTYSQHGLGAYDGVFHDNEPVNDYYVTNDAIIFAGNLGVTEGGASVAYYWETYHLMGAPSVSTYLGIPDTNKILHDAAVVISATSMTVEADPGSYVALTIGRNIIGTALVDASGIVDIPVSFTVPGPVDIVITWQNRIPYISTFQVVAPFGPFVVYDFHQVDDATTGNGNGYVENGESILLDMQLKHVGADDALDVSAILRTSDTYVTMTDSTSDYGTIPTDAGTSFVSQAFAFVTAPETPDGHEVLFDLEITGSTRETWTGFFSVPIHSPILDQVLILIDDTSDGDGDGVLDPGESAELIISIENTGSSPAYLAEAYLVESDEFLSVNDDYGYFGDIVPATTVDNSGNTIVITADADCQPGYPASMELLVTAGAYTVTLNLNILIGNRDAVFQEDFYDTDGWTGLGSDAQWEIAAAAGLGGDPTEDHTSSTSDNFILGNDISDDGKYNNDINDTCWVVSPIIDCGSVKSVFLNYWHWLGCTNSNSDHVFMDVFDGTDWVRLFENSSTVQEHDWYVDSIDISDYANYNTNFRLRFGLGPTDDSYNLTGWNIDDIEVIGYLLDGTPVLLFPSSQLTDSIQPGDQDEVILAIENPGDGQLAVSFTTNDSWLSCSDEQLVIDPGETADLPVTLNTSGLTVGDHLGSLNYTTNDKTNGSGEVPVLLHVFIPDVDVQQTSIDHTIDPGTQTTIPLTIDNNGPGRLTYQVRCTMDQSKSSGGPDDHGYSWIDSDDPEGPSYGWLDISNEGTSIALDEDQSAGPFPIGFGFPFYDSVYTHFYLTSNGYITFDAPSVISYNQQLPYYAMGTSAIAMFWDDLNPAADGHVFSYYDEAAGYHVISFVDIPMHYPPLGTGSLFFQARLNRNGVIELYYFAMNPGALTLNSATIGIQNSACDDGLQIAYYAEYMHNYLSIEIATEHWLVPESRNGTVDPYGSSSLDITLDAEELELGTYTATLTILSDDPDTPSWDVPVTLTVSETCCVGMVGNVDCDPSESVDGIDLATMIDILFITLGDACCFEEANVDYEGDITGIDLSVLIDHLFISLNPLENCQ